MLRNIFVTIFVTLTVFSAPAFAGEQKDKWTDADLLHIAADAAEIDFGCSISEYPNTIVCPTIISVDDEVPTLPAEIKVDLYEPMKATKTERKIRLGAFKVIDSNDDMFGNRIIKRTQTRVYRIDRKHVQQVTISITMGHPL